jgi:hypothetical protein
MQTSGLHDIQLVHTCNPDMSHIKKCYSWTRRGRWLGNEDGRALGERLGTADGLELGRLDGRALGVWLIIFARASDFDI